MGSRANRGDIKATTPPPIDAVDEVRRAEFPQRPEDARSDQRQEMAAVEPLEEPGAETAWPRPEPVVSVEPARLQGLEHLWD
jgi:hypothetical protein